MHLELHPLGPFSLAASSRFIEGFPAGQGGGEGRLDLAFCADGDWRAIGVRVRDAEDHDGVVAEVRDNPGGVARDVVLREVERILSLDVDGTGLPSLADRDPIVRDLQRRYPGLRPVQFPTPYEAAAWAIIGHRIRMTQAARIKTGLAEGLGESVDFGDRQLPAFPSPDRLARLGPTPGLTDRKVQQLRDLGRAAADGRLDARRLRAQPREEALRELQALPGIGPFSAELVLLRGAGDPDAFPRHERRLHRAMTALYRPESDADLGDLERIADAWRPYRTWVALLIGAGSRTSAGTRCEEARMAVALNHTIVHCRSKQESAEFLADLLGLGRPVPFGPFVVVQLANGVSLDFTDVPDAAPTPQHYAFLVSESEFDEIFGRIRGRRLPYWADPAKRRPGEHNTNDGGRGVYWEDPNGHYLEIITRPYGG